MARYITKCYASSMRRVFRTRTFTRWMEKAGLSDKALLKAIDEITKGLIDANLGGNLVKKRVALPGRGKSGGARTIVATKMMGRWFFIYGFNKNERSNIEPDELKALQELAEDYLRLDEKQLEEAVKSGKMTEITE